MALWSVFMLQVMTLTLLGVDAIKRSRIFPPRVGLTPKGKDPVRSISSVISRLLKSPPKTMRISPLSQVNSSVDYFLKSVY